MTIVKRYAFGFVLTFCALAASAQAQTPQVSTVNISPDAEKVRVAIVGDVLDMRIAVSDEAGDVVFESGPVTAAHLDWTMSGDGGQRIPPGAYTLTVTYRTSNGKLKRRVEQVLVAEEVTSGGASSIQESPTPTAVGTITGEGTAGRISKFTGPNSIGNSVIFENAARIGFGTTAPQQSLHAVGASSRLRLQSTNGTALTTTEYVTNGRVWQAGAGGSTAANGVANKFFILDQTANQFRLVIDPAGNVGVGTTAPASKLAINGQIQILGAGNGIKFADGSIQTKATSGTINGTGAANRLAKFTGPNSFGNSTITENGGNVGIGTTMPTRPLEIAGGKLRMSSPLGDIEFTETADLIAYATTANPASALPAFRVDVGTGLARAFTVLNNGRVGIGTGTPAVNLQVQGSGIAEAQVKSVNERAILSLDSTLGGQNRVWTLENGVFGSAGTFAVFDRTAAQARLVITPAGEVVLGQITNAREQASAKLKAIADKLSSGHGSTGLLAIGGNSDDSDGGTGISAFGGDVEASGTFGGTGIFAQGGNGIAANGATSGYAAFIQGGRGLRVNGSFSASGSKDFKIDHPLDPENKYLRHASVESSEVLNFYSGNVVLDKKGEAVVTMPAWFEALNRDFRYQLTPIGAPGRGLYVAEEINQNRFKIAGGSPGMKVSWQVTGVRSDAYMRTHPFVVEEDKTGRERGTYVSPEAFGQPEERGMVWALFPEPMRRQKERREKARSEQAASPAP